MSKTEANIAFFLLCTSAFVAACASILNGERLKTLEEKIQLRDSIIVHTQEYVEHRDSMILEYIDSVVNINNN